MTSIEFPEAPADKKRSRKARSLRRASTPNGLVTAVVTDAGDGMLLMVAHMNAEALALTLETGIAHYWSRSRGQPVEEGRNIGQRPAGRRDAHRLRPGRDVAARKSRGPRCNLSHGPAFLLLSDGGADRWQGDDLQAMAAQPLFDAEKTYRKQLVNHSPP